MTGWSKNVIGLFLLQAEELQYLSVFHLIKDPLKKLQLTLLQCHYYLLLQSGQVISLLLLTLMTFRSDGKMMSSVCKLLKNQFNRGAINQAIIA